MNERLLTHKSIALKTRRPARRSTKSRDRLKAFRMLRRKTRKEIELTLRYLKTTQDHVPYVKGTILTTYRLDPLRLNDKNLNDALIPEYSDGIRQWPIPNNPMSITDLGGELVSKAGGDEFPSVVDLYDFNLESIKRLRRLHRGLITLRTLYR